MTGIPPADRRDAVLPAPMTGFVGRERELTELTSLVQRPGVRLITLTGSGGVGKTRLALETIRRIAAGPAAPDVAWVEVAPVRHASEVLPAVARTLGVLTLDEADVVGQLVDAVKGRTVMLGLDNLEHVVGVGTAIVHLLTQARELTVIVTSRRPLGVYGEHLYRVAPLELDDAVRLLIDRARSSDSRWVASADDSETMDRICRAVDLLPLAIELVAPRLPESGPLRLAAALTPTSGARAAASPIRELLGPRGMPARHRSLRRTLQWSVQLLDQEEREAFGQLASFAGDFDLSGAAAVCRPVDPALVVRSLLDHSLLDLVASGPERARMLPSVRGFAQTLLTADRWAEARDAHAGYITDLAVTAQEPRHPTRWPEPEQATALDALVEEISHALSWLRERGHGGDIALAASMWPYWHLRGRITFAAGWLRPALNDDELEPTVRGHALLGLTWISIAGGIAGTAMAAAHRAVAEFRGLGDRLGLASALAARAGASSMSGDRASTDDYYAEAVEASRAASDPITLTLSLVNWADLHLINGAPAKAEQCLLEAQVVGADLLDGRHMPGLLLNLGLARLARDDTGAALADFRGALAAGASEPNTGFHIALLVALASVAVRCRRFESAATLCAVVDAVTATSEDRVQPYLGDMHERTRSAARDALTESAFDRAWRSGRGLSIEQALELADQD